VNKEHVSFRGHLEEAAAPYQAPRRVMVEPEEGVRLIRAFLRVEDPTVRAAIISFTEALQNSPSGPN
jgi:hypothetical protein